MKLSPKEGHREESKDRIVRLCLKRDDDDPLLEYDYLFHDDYEYFYDYLLKYDQLFQQQKLY